MKKTLSKIIAISLLLSILLSAVSTCYAETVLSVTDIGKESKKVINIVYDDSGSMVNGNETDVSNSSAYVATWAQAKYSLEAFTAMMNDDDVLNIYCMSGAGKLAKTVKGSDRKDGVDEIHSDFKTGDYSVLTPIQTLKAAYEGLSDSKYNDCEKWLVVLTDGAFTVSNSSGEKVSDSEVSRLLSSYGSSLSGRLIYIPIGSSANEYQGSEFKTLKASSGEEILSQVKAATEYIYSGRDKKEISETSISLGVSMKKIIVFAQGAGVEIEGTSKGQISNNISVKYTDAENAVKYDNSKTTFSGNEDKIKTDNSLQGVVATIEPNGDCIEPGQLNISFGDVTPKSYTIYYEPAVKAYYSLEKDGVEYISSENPTDGGSLNPGTYKLTAYIADAFQKTEDSKPLDVSDAQEIQDINFDLKLSGSGVVGGSQAFSTQELRNGVNVELEKGEIECDAQASILYGKYAVDTTALSNAFGNIIVKDTYRLEVSYEKPTADLLSYRFKKTNFTLHSLKKIDDKEDMIKAIVTCYDNNGNKVDITEEQWATVNAQTVKIYNGEKTKVQYDQNAFDFHVENGCGVFYLCPRYWTENDKADKGKTTHTNYLHGKRFCEVRTELNLDISDSLAYSTLGTETAKKSTTYEIALCILHTIAGIIIFIIIIGLIFKKKLPKTKRAKAELDGYYYKSIDEDGNVVWRPEDELGSDKWISIEISSFIDFISRIVPFMSQRGTVKLPGVTNLKIKATQMTGKRTRVRLMNPPSNFESINGSEDIGDGNRYIRTSKGSITKETLENLKKNHKKYEFSMTGIRFGSDMNDGTFAAYKGLSFIKERKKRK